MTSNLSVLSVFAELQDNIVQYTCMRTHFRPNRFRHVPPGFRQIHIFNHSDFSPNSHFQIYTSVDYRCWPTDKTKTNNIVGNNIELLLARTFPT